jgi:hypothetical protein
MDESAQIERRKKYKIKMENELVFRNR